MGDPPCQAEIGVFGAGFELVAIATLDAFGAKIAGGVMDTSPGLTDLPDLAGFGGAPLEASIGIFFAGLKAAAIGIATGSGLGAFVAGGVVSARGTLADLAERTSDRRLPDEAAACIQAALFDEILSAAGLADAAFVASGVVAARRTLADLAGRTQIRRAPRRTQAVFLTGL